MRIYFVPHSKQTAYPLQTRLRENIKPDQRKELKIEKKNP